jgi:hypothetical protein
MAIGNTTRDFGNLPMGCVLVPGDNTPQPLKGGKEYTDAGSNIMAPVCTSPEDGSKATYSAAMQALVPVTGCTDLFTITGSATKTIRVTKIGLVGTTITTPITVEIQLIKRSTANTAGTSSAPTNRIAYDSTNPSVTATVLGYTANPTLGTVAGILSAEKVVFTIPSTATMLQGADRWWKDFGTRPAQAIVLRGTSEVLAINLVGTTLGTACSCDVYVEWTEE